MLNSATSSTFSLVVVSNRLPVSFSIDQTGARFPTISPGGLVAAVAPVVRGKNSAWVGWSGIESDQTSQFVAGGITLFPVSLNRLLVERHYQGFSNSTLWPLFHDVGVIPELHESWWKAYQEVNALCAKRAAEVVAPEGIVWVHDYQMMLVPSLLRELRDDITIGYFHHIPFCGANHLRQLPQHEEIVRGVAGADIAGFQRDSDTDHFTDVARALLGEDMTAHATTYPISVDFGEVSKAASEPGVCARASELRAQWGHPSTVFLGVDRIDYTKGIPERLEAFEALLASGRISSKDCVMVQAGSPSRKNVPSYRALQSQVDEIVARINAHYTSSSGRPAVIYLAENLPRHEMLALFSAADVMVVSSLRDGMNLVAKEFIACRKEDTGVLILSPHTGAADHLVDALISDPTNPDELQGAMLRAMTMDEAEQRRRMSALRAEVSQHDVAWWAGIILDDLASHAKGP